MSISVSDVKKLKPIVATLLLALFAFVSSHALLENLELIHHHEGHPSDSAHSDLNHDAADGLCRIDSSLCKIQKPAPELPSHFVTAVLTGLLNTPDQSQLFLFEHVSPPLELVSTWQFSSRTALPARAPSFVS
ncbi:MAG: hypothetical protein ABIR24_11265 [Verrucomicrobiota bacterium]